LSGEGGSTRAALAALSDRLAAGDVVVIDGATGTELQARGVPMDDAAWCGVANLEQPDVVRDVHADYIRAGASVVIANTFSTDRLRLGDAGLADRTEEANRNAVAAALGARELTGREDVVVAGSLSRTVAFAIDGTPRPVSPETLAEVYGEQAGLLADAGAELLALEMISAVDYGKAALAAASATGLAVWLGLSADRAPDGRLVGWQEQSLDFEELVASLVSPDLAAVLVMHSDVDVVDDALAVVRRHWDGPLGAYPHVGTFAPPDWEFDETFTPDELVRRAARWIDAGAQIVGGCCGLGPEFIRALSEAYR
jgi:homocysteine S-methyltransferase